VKAASKASRSGHASFETLNALINPIISPARHSVKQKDGLNQIHETFQLLMQKNDGVAASTGEPQATP
jgi:hypothetical protein